MAMVKEIMGQRMVEALFYFDASTGPYSHLRSCTQMHKMFPLFPTFSCSVLTPQELKTVAYQAAPLAPVAKDVCKRTLDLKPPVTLTLTGTVTIKSSKEMMDLMLQYFDTFNNTLRERGMVMQLVSTEIDPTTMEPKLSNRAVLDWSRDFHVGAERSTHRVEFEIDSNFGLPGAILVTNKYDKEIFLEGISIEGFVDISCNSWVQPEKVHPEKRIFFSNKAYLPCHTPEGLKELRKAELRQLRGDGKGVRKGCDRVYDYDVYNDLGNPDKGNEHTRPILGAKQFPSPRRCRTGRPPATTGESHADHGPHIQFNLRTCSSLVHFMFSHY